MKEGPLGPPFFHPARRDHPTAAERKEDRTASAQPMAAPKGRGPEARVKLLQIYEGTNQIQRLVIAQEIQQGN